MNDVCHPAVFPGRNPQPQIRQSKRRGNAVAHECTKILARAPFDDFCEHPEGGSSMVNEPLADRKFQAPGFETFEPLVVIKPFRLRIRCVRKTTSMQEQMFDRDRILTVSAEFRNDIRSAFVEFELPFAEQDPDRRRDNGLGATEYAIQGCISGWFVIAALHRMAKSLHRANFSVTCDGDLA